MDSDRFNLKDFVAKWRREPASTETRGARTKLARHDAHNLELKIFYDEPCSGKKIDLDLYLFLPASLHLGVCEKTDLIRDFHSRLRLANAASLQFNSIDSEIQALKSEIAKWNSDLDFDERANTNEQIFAISRHLGAVFGEALKAKAASLSKDIFLPQSLLAKDADPSPELFEVDEKVLEVRTQVRELRSLIREVPESFPALVLLDQYLSVLYVDFLSRVREAFDRHEGTTEGHIKLGQTLDRLQSDEVFEGQDLSHLENLELEGLHISRLKKFFQSELFLDVTQRQALKRIAEPAAASAALIAGGIVGVIEHVLKHEGLTFGFPTALAVAVGVALYALKDRMKDRGRALLNSVLAKKFPDIERELFVNGKMLGKIREWYSVTKTSKLPDNIRKARHQVCSSDLEKHLPEEVLHYRKHTLCSTNSSLRENLRINMHRYLRHMDEPLKMVRRLSRTGQIETVRQPRVYHIYAAIFAGDSDAHTYRVVMDKTGVIRCERL